MKTYKVNELVEGVEYCSGVGNVYKIHKGRLCILSDYHDGWTESYNSYNAVFDMVFTECEFNPMNGEYYWFPSFVTEGAVSRGRWKDDLTDERIKNRIGVYRTSEQALEKAKELGWI